MTNHPIDRDKLVTAIQKLIKPETRKYYDCTGNINDALEDVIYTINSGELDYDPWVSVDERLPQYKEMQEFIVQAKYSKERIGDEGYPVAKMRDNWGCYLREQFYVFTNDTDYVKLREALELQYRIAIAPTLYPDVYGVLLLHGLGVDKDITSSVIRKIAVLEDKCPRTLCLKIVEVLSE
jgi:hypothetical protein